MTQVHSADQLLQDLRTAYLSHAEMQAFTAFPDDIRAQTCQAHHYPCAELFLRDTVLRSGTYADLHASLRRFGRQAHWRETYKDTDIGQDFMDRFGCYCIIGEQAPFTSDRIRLFMVYMPAGLSYPWHHHPAEEIYLVIAGEGVFRAKGRADVTLREGQTAFHQGHQPHAMYTKASAVLCLVAWHDQFDIPPVLTPPGGPGENA